MSSSSTTLPKSIQAQAEGRNESDGASGSQPNRATTYREFVNKLKNLPDDFLKIPASNQPDFQAISAAQQALMSTREASMVDAIDISVVEAQLVKNYGLLRMDLYCKIRVGHMVCETPTCVNGAKNPKWDGVYQFNLKPGIDSFHLEIYDEKQISTDEKIAWLSEPIPAEIFRGITVERWFHLSGRLGHNKEGSVLLVISHKRVPMRPSNIGRAMIAHHPGAPMTVFVPAGNHGPVITGPGVISPNPQIPTYIQPPPELTGQQQRQRTTDVGPASEEDINQLSEMFPSIDKAIIKAILENNHHDKEASIGALLALG